ncbi:MAG: hypothetical protein E3J83_06165 [Candidatus Atribacteria bacterium]|nr:MAG: hypothetical protein E3J83_06165 [Candidatus Atribacteria bacterium]
MRVGYNVATNKKNTLDLPRFHCTGVGNSVPDIFFWDPDYEDEIFNLVHIPRQLQHIRAGFGELKFGDHFSELINGVIQNTRYYGYFITNNAQISINGERIHNVDAFLLATNWSRTGMLYKGDEDLLPNPIPYMSEKYNFVVPPFTMMMHSLQRKFQNLERKKLRNEGLTIASNKLKVQTGIMISKIPYNENSKISYEYYAWMGNKLLPIVANDKYNPEYIRTKVKVHGMTEKAVLAETVYQKMDWFPKSQIKFSDEIKSIKIGEWYNIEVALWYYKKMENMFGII